MLKVNSHSQLRFRHVGAFTLLFLLSVIQPTSIWPSIPFSFAPVTLLILVVLLISKIINTIGLQNFFKNYRWELCLVSLYQCLCFISLIYNRERFETSNEFASWGLTLVIVQFALPLTVWLFSLPQGQNKLSLSRQRYGWVFIAAIFLLIPFVAIWQKLDNQSAFSFYRYFIAGNIGDVGNIRSVFAISTDLGAITAIISISCFSIAACLAKQGAKSETLIFTLVGMLNLVSGFLSGARVFILMIALTIIAVLILRFRKRIDLLVLSALIFILSTVLIVQLSPVTAIVKLGGIFPAVFSVNLGTELLLSDSIPVFAETEQRIAIWTRALSYIVENPLLGISNGGFRLTGDSMGNNTHNILLQTAIDGGIFATLVFVILLILILKRSNSTAIRVLVLSCFCGLMVDNFSDHSLPWMVVTVACVASFTQDWHPRMTPQEINQRLSTWFAIVGLGMLICVLFIHYSKSSALNKMHRFEQLELVYPIFSGKRKQGFPVIVNQSFIGADFGEPLPPILRLFTQIDEKYLCSYAYPDSVIVSNSLENIEFKHSRNISETLTLYSEPVGNCELALSSPLGLSNWVSNNADYFGKQILNQGLSELWLSDESVVVWSPIFEPTHELLSFDVEVSSLVSQTSIMSVSLHCGFSGEVIDIREVSFNTNVSKVSFNLSTVSQSKVYIGIQLEQIDSDANGAIKSSFLVHNFALQ